MSYIPQVSGDPKELRSGALTGSFVNTLALKTQMWNQVVLFIDATLDSATDIRIRIEAASPTRTPGKILDDEPSAGSSEWHSIAFQGGATEAAGVASVPVETFEIVLTASGRKAFPLPVNYQWIRCSAKATGTVGSATLTIKATTGMA